MIDLSGPWALSDDSGSYRTVMGVPGDGISALFDAGLIPDPYWSQNEYDLRWIAGRDWTISREVPLDRTDYRLVAEMIDTVAEIRVNGHIVGLPDSMFRRQEFSIAGAAKAGMNLIEITFRSPLREGERRQAALPFPVPYHKGNCPLPNGNMLRKPQCDFGWDWNIALAPFGVYERIWLEPLAAPRVTAVTVGQQHEDGAVVVSVRAETDQVPDGSAVRITLCGVETTAQVRAGRFAASLRIVGPQLWWPAGLGPQILHELSIQAGDAGATRRIGLRDLRHITTPDAAGARFAFSVNGHAVFMRGANWIPADALAGRITRDAVRGLLQSAVDANMNMVRIWGGGRYEPDWFYDLCDEMGLLIWQDFMFACHLYPSTEEFLAEIDAEVRDVALRIGHHACIALWCGDNELLGALTWFKESRDNRDRYLVAYDRLNRTVEHALRSALPEAIWWPSSPSPGLLSFGDAWHDDRSGDMHFWSVWHEGRDFDHYRDVSPRFCSEFGFQSYPSLQAIRRFADPADFNISAPVMESHQKNSGGNARIAETMFRYFRFPVDFENFVYLSQIQQGLAIKTAVTHWRSLKPHCMGTLYWQLNDTWPVCSWSSLDHGGNWKLLHYMARRFYAPVLVTAVPDGDGIVFRAVNDRREALSLEVAIRAARMDGTTRALGDYSIDVGPDAAVEVVRLAAKSLEEGEILAFTWKGSDGTAAGDIHNPHPWKAHDLVAPKITLTAKPAGTETILTLVSKALAPFVALEADVPGRFSNNAFTLFPATPATVSFTADDPEARPCFVVRDLHSATYGQEA